MKLAIVLAALVSVCAVTAVPVQRVAHPRLLTVPSELEARSLFESFKSTYARTYHPDEEPVRFTIFKESLARAASRNQRDPTATFGVTQFSDLTVKEFKQRYLNKRPTRANPAVGVWPRGPSAANVTKVDWREKGAVTPVKNQGQCGSCWAFSTVEEIESMLFLEKGPPLHDFSTQQVVDCDNVDQGCNGGDTTTGYKYVMKAGGLEPNQDYPYQSGNSGSAGQCQADPSKFVPIPLEGFRYAVPGCYGPCKKDNKERAEELADKLAGVGPISICVFAEPWQDYTGGVLSTNCDKNYNDLDHCVQLVGYDRSGTQPYWMIRNSWAASWGIDGYIHVEMGKNLCGVQDEATIAEIKGDH